MGTAGKIRIGFVGFGEVGQTFARGLIASGRVSVAAWDVLFATPRGAALEAAAGAIGVHRAAGPAEVVETADIVVSAVTADQVTAVAQQLRPLMRRGQVLFDVNSAAPLTKAEAAGLIESAGADYVEGAVMAPVAPKGLATPILAGGPAAAALAGTLNGLGMAIEPVSREFGRASAMKLCRSIVIKGLEAILVESAEASRQWGVSDEVFGSLALSFPSIDWRQLTADMRRRVERHGVRRAAEMREAAEMLRSKGREPGLALAIADVQERYARPQER